MQQERRFPSQGLGRRPEPGLVQRLEGRPEPGLVQGLERRPEQGLELALVVLPVQLQEEAEEGVVHLEGEATDSLR